MQTCVDIHCHVLFDIDDGAADSQVALEMCRRAKKVGYSALIATPHFDLSKAMAKASSGDQKARKVSDAAWIQQVCKTSVETVEKKIAALQGMLDDEKIDLTIHPGMEIMIRDDAVLEVICSKQLLSLNYSRFVLIEFSTKAPFHFIQEAIYNIAISGMVPVLAHTERYSALFHHPGYLDKIKNMGCVIQINGSSLFPEGQSGSPATWHSVAVDMLKRGNADVIATDAHNLNQRGYPTSSYDQKLATLVGHENAEKLLSSNGHCIINDQCVQPLDKSKIPSKAILRQVLSKSRGQKILAGAIVLIVAIALGLWYAYDSTSSQIEERIQGEISSNRPQIEAMMGRIEQQIAEKESGASAGVSEQAELKTVDQKVGASVKQPKIELLQTGQNIEASDETKAISSSQAQKPPTSAKQQMSTEDRAKSMYILKKSLSVAQLQRVKVIFVDGFTSSEISEMESMMSNSLSGGDFAYLKAIYQKYYTAN